jgi:hypothetical protein
LRCKLTDDQDGCTDDCLQMVTSISLYLSRDVLKLHKGSFSSKYAQLFIGFGVSGLCHSVASVLVSGEDGGRLKFFLLQGAAIFAEDMTQELGKAVGLRERGLITRCVGHVWVFAWFSYSLRGLVDGGLRQGVWLHSPFPHGGVKWLVCSTFKRFLSHRHDFEKVMQLSLV